MLQISTIIAIPNSTLTTIRRTIRRRGASAPSRSRGGGCLLRPPDSWARPAWRRGTARPAPSLPTGSARNASNRARSAAWAGQPINPVARHRLQPALVGEEIVGARLEIRADPVEIDLAGHAVGLHQLDRGRRSFDRWQRQAGRQHPIPQPACDSLAPGARLRPRGTTWRYLPKPPDFWKGPAGTQNRPSRYWWIRCRYRAASTGRPIASSSRVAHTRSLMSLLPPDSTCSIVACKRDSRKSRSSSVRSPRSMAARSTQ